MNSEIPERQLFIDVETANRKRHSICQIGITFVSGISVVESISIHINPDCEFEPINMNVHGITPTSVAGKNTFPEVYERLKRVLTCYPVFHHSDFDKQAINQACHRYGFEPLLVEWRDTVILFKDKFPEITKYNLLSLCEKFRIEHYGHHDAGQDSLALASVTNMAFKNIHLALPSSVLPSEKHQNVSSKGVVVFTGDMNKVELTKLAKQAGYEIAKSVTKKTTTVCCGRVDQRTLEAGRTKSGKLLRAEELITNGQAIDIVSEIDFRRQLTA